MKNIQSGTAEENFIPPGISGSFQIEAPRGRAGEESDSVKDILIALFAYPAAEPTGKALTGIHEVVDRCG
jgi:hypothetical protein